VTGETLRGTVKSFPVARPIVLWAVPRSVSTAFERAVCQSLEIAAEHEPFTDCFYFGPERMSSRYRGEIKPAATSAMTIKRLMDSADALCGEPRPRRLFVKELAFQALPFVTDDFLTVADHAVILRHPSLVYESLMSLKPDFTDLEFGFDALARITQRITALTGRSPLIFEGTDFRAEPERNLRVFCHAMGLRFTRQMLSWERGRIREWRADEQESQAGWHTTLERSKGILKPDGAWQASELRIQRRHRGVFDRACSIYEAIFPPFAPADWRMADACP
jgi:Sulfotransferase domain